ncbi:MAG: helix-turn-helix domain-containing protein [Anaerolineae bacterium]|nr:helix-turn-helix domain-containing protein [Anaerolineae bacterium]
MSYIVYGPIPRSPNFGIMLRFLRNEAGLTQKQLADRVNYTAAYISRLEKGNRIPNVVVVREEFIKALGLPQEHRLAISLIELASKLQQRL